MLINSEVFLNKFNLFEKYLQDKYNNSNYMSYRDLVRNTSYNNGIIKRFKRDLYMFGDLRNVLVHNTRINGKIIAEPIDDILERFDFIVKEIQYPEKVAKFKKQVYQCFSDDKLSKALNFIHDFKISQIPVIQNGEIVDVLNGNHIAAWLARKENVSLSQVSIADVLLNADRNKNFGLISENTPIYEAAEIYKKSFQKPPVNWYFDALIITPNGLANELMTGIIVLKDIASYMQVD